MDWAMVGALEFEAMRGGMAIAPQEFLLSFETALT
jgi:hypothetical protein